MKIKKENIKRGIAASLLVIAIGGAGVMLHNGEESKDLAINFDSNAVFEKLDQEKLLINSVYYTKLDYHQRTLFIERWKSLETEWAHYVEMGIIPELDSINNDLLNEIVFLTLRDNVSLFFENDADFEKYRESVYDLYSEEKINNRSLNYIMPEYLEYNESIAAKVPAGYSVYPVVGEPLGLLSIENVEDAKVYSGANGTSLENYMGIKDNVYMALRFYDAFVERYQNGTLSTDLYRMPEVIVDENNYPMVKVEDGYGLIQVGENSTMGMYGIEYKDGYTYYMGCRNSNFDNFIIVPRTLDIFLDYARKSKMEARVSFENEFGTKSFN